MVGGDLRSPRGGPRHSAEGAESSFKRAEQEPLYRDRARSFSLEARENEHKHAAISNQAGSI